MALAALVLAAGRGQRFGSDKLAAPFRGRPLIDHAVQIACAAPVERIIVVARPDTAVNCNDTRLSVCRLDSSGMAQSLRAGLDAAGDAEGVFIFLADMPLVPATLAATLLAAKADHLAVVPLHRGQPGHPVLLNRCGFALAADLTGDTGLGRVLRSRDDVLFVPVSDAGVLRDVDTPQALAEIESAAD